MNCREIEKLLPEYASNLLGDRERAAVKAHLKTCPSCRNELSEIEKLFCVTGPALQPREVDVPEGYFETVWPALYSRIQAERLTQPVPSVLERVRGIVRFAGRRSFQLVNVGLILVFSIWLYVSHQKGKVNIPSPFLQDIVSSYTSEVEKEMAEKVSEGQDIIADVMTFGLDSTDQPLEKWGRFLSPEKQEQMYDSLTDYLANMLIKLETMKT